MRTAAPLLLTLVALTITAAAQNAPPGATPRNGELEQAIARVKAGRTYAAAKTGRITLTSIAGDQTLDNVLDVPANYDPAKRWPLRVNLHGGVGRTPPRQGEDDPRPLSNRIPLDDELVLQPRAWASTEWWTTAQVDNIAQLIARVKRSYNVDESRVSVTGISDGGTGVYYLAMRDATMWAACLPLNGHPLVLANASVGADGLLFPTNARNCPMHAVNGGRDRLYPAASVEPFIDLFRRAGTTLDWQVYPEANHDVSWWPQERDRYRAFLTAHPRVAHPDTISWETEQTQRYNRFRWLVIQQLGTRPSDARLDDVNSATIGRDRAMTVYQRGRPSGRVDAVRRDNTFDLQTRGVRELTLLLSRDVIDIARPVRVVVNGKTVHDARVTEDVATLNEWAGRDQDRTMVYTAALRVSVP